MGGLFTRYYRTAIGSHQLPRFPKSTILSGEAESRPDSGRFEADLGSVSNKRLAARLRLEPCEPGRSSLAPTYKAWAITRAAQRLCNFSCSSGYSSMRAAQAIYSSCSSSYRTRAAQERETERERERLRQHERYNKRERGSQRQRQRVRIEAVEREKERQQERESERVGSE